MQQKLGNIATHVGKVGSFTCEWVNSGYFQRLKQVNKNDYLKKGQNGWKATKVNI